MTPADNWKGSSAASGEALRVVSGPKMALSNGIGPKRNTKLNVKKET
jgi:hypothetical protein